MDTRVALPGFVTLPLSKDPPITVAIHLIASLQAGDMKGKPYTSVMLAIGNGLSYSVAAPLAEVEELIRISR